MNRYALLNKDNIVTSIIFTPDDFETPLGFTKVSIPEEVTCYVKYSYDSETGSFNAPE